MKHSLILIALLLGTSCSHHTPKEPKREVATIGIAVTSAFSVPTGLFLSALGGFSILAGSFRYGYELGWNKTAPPEQQLSTWAKYVALLGLILLDENRQGALIFQSLDKKNAKKIGLSETERKAYNDELPLINLVSDELRRQALKKQVKEITPKSQAQMRAAYKKLAKEVGLSQTAQNAVAKLIRHSVKKSVGQSPNTNIDNSSRSDSKPSLYSNEEDAQSAPARTLGQ